MKINLYDFDNTILNGDSSVRFFLFCLKKKPIIFITLPKMLWYLIKYKLNMCSKTQMKEIIFSFLKYLDNVDNYVEMFWKENTKHIKKFYLEKKHGNDIIISASPSFLLEPMKKYLGVLDIIASDVDKKTGHFIKENCHGEEKVKRLNELYQDYEVLESYSDSLSDTPILKLAKNAYLVKGDKVIPYK